MSSSLTPESNLSQYTFTWKIKNFLSCPDRCGEKIVSPSFQIEDESWNSELYPRGNCYMVKDYITILINRPTYYSQEASTSKVVVTDGKCEIVDPYNNISECIEFKDHKLIILEFLANEFEEKMKCWNEDTLTIRLELSINVKDRPKRKCEFEATTVIDVRRCTLRWDMENFNFMVNEKPVTLSDSKVKFLKIILSVSEEDVIIIVQTMGESGLPQRVTFRMTFLNYTGTKIATRCETHSFESADPWQFPTFIKKKILPSVKAVSSRCKCSLICEFIIPQGGVLYSKMENCTISAVVNNDIILQPRNTTALHCDFQTLFISKKYSDIKLRIQNEEFPTHRAVLAARSPVFAAMFDQDMLENQTGVVDIVDMDVKTLQYLIQYIYTETMDGMDYESAFKLLLAADKYQVQTLKEECSIFLMNTLTTENVCTVVSVADMVNHEGLKTHALNHIFVNASKILATTDWYQWVKNNGNLAAEILCKYTKYLERDKECQSPS